jgi:cytochrome c5
MKSYLTIFTLALVLFGFIFVEHHLDTPGHSEAQRESLLSDGSGIAARIAAVGQINVAQAQSTTQVAAASESAVDGEKVYQSACIACHGAGGGRCPDLGCTDRSRK